jgi:hypothetical protein
MSLFAGGSPCSPVDFLDRREHFLARPVNIDAQPLRFLARPVNMDARPLRFHVHRESFDARAVNAVEILAHREDPAGNVDVFHGDQDVSAERFALHHENVLVYRERFPMREEHNEACPVHLPVTPVLEDIHPENVFALRENIVADRLDRESSRAKFFAHAENNEIEALLQDVHAVNVLARRRSGDAAYESLRARWCATHGERREPVSPTVASFAPAARSMRAAASATATATALRSSGFTGG